MIGTLKTEVFKGQVVILQEVYASWANHHLELASYLKGNDWISYQKETTSLTEVTILISA